MLCSTYIIRFRTSISGKMVLKGKGRILPHIRGGYYIYISKDVVSDSAFPFKAPEDVSVRIEGRKIVVEKARK
jgi:hypothetical protein